MKLLYLANNRLPTEKAHGKQIMETCHALSELGMSIDMLIPKRINSIKDEIFSYYGLPCNFSIKKIFCFDLIRLPFGKKFFYILESASFSPSALFFLIKHRQKYDVIFTRDLFLFLLGRLIFKPVFYEVHNLPRCFNWWQKIALRHLCGIVAISDGLRLELIKRGFSADKIMVARDAVDVEKFVLSISQKEAREQLSLSLEKKIIVYTGHLYDWKGANLLAEAASKLPVDFEVYLVGGTKDDLKSFAQKHYYSNLHLIGHRPISEIPLWLKAADLVVLPNSAKFYNSVHYTSPLKLFEYVASGTPIVSADLPSIREIVDDNEVIFFQPDQIDSLVHAIKIGIKDLLGWKECAILLQKRAFEYTWRVRAKKIMIFFKTKLN